MTTKLRLPEINRYHDRTAPTPLVPVRVDDAGPTIWCKLEFLNPSGSTKDRIAGYILSKALRRGEIAPGGTVVEASSGSTSIAMALACAQLGLSFVAVMPEGVSRERRLMIQSYGGEVIFSPSGEGMRGALAGAAREAARRGGFSPLQFSNPDNSGPTGTRRRRRSLRRFRADASMPSSAAWERAGRSSGSVRDSAILVARSPPLPPGP